MPLPALDVVFRGTATAATSLQQCDAQLPPELRLKLASLLGVRFGQYSAERVTMPRVFIPFEWFFIGAALVPLYKALGLYKAPIESIATSKGLRKEDFERSRSGTIDPQLASGIDALNKDDYSDQDKLLLRSFVTDYSWWRGSKTIDRGDFHASSLCQAANILAASASFLVEEIVPALSVRPEIVAALMSNLVQKPVPVASGDVPDFYAAFSSALKTTNFAAPS